MERLPDPKALINSVADGAIELAEGLPRVAKNVAAVAETFASSVQANMEMVKNRMPEDPMVIPDAAIKGAGDTLKAGIGMVEAVGNGVKDTFEAVKAQITKITR